MDKRFEITPIAFPTLGGEKTEKKGASAAKNLGERDKKILYRLAKKRCEACGKRIEYDEMQAGHKLARSKGHAATLQNSVCLCWRCNNLQGTDSWKTFMQKQGKEPISATDYHPKPTGKSKPTGRKGRSKPDNPFNVGSVWG